MTTIDPNNNYCTLINVFTAAPEKQLELYNALKRATEDVMVHLPGYISVNLHLGDDKRTVTNYAQWASMEDFSNMLQNEDARKYMQEAAALAVDFKHMTYTNIWTHGK